MLRRCRHYICRQMRSVMLPYTMQHQQPSRPAVATCLLLLSVHHVTLGYFWNKLLSCVFHHCYRSRCGTGETI